MSPYPETVLFVDHASALGGAERSLLLILQHLDRGSLSPQLVGASGPLLEQARTLGVATSMLELPRLRRSTRSPFVWWRTAQALALLTGELDAGLVVANTVRSAIYASLAARLARVPFVWHMRDFWLSETRPRWTWLDSIGKRFLVNTAALVITNSAAVAAHLPSSGKVQVVPNGINPAEFDPTRTGLHFRRQYGVPAEAPLVGMVGRLRPWKGQRTFLEMAAQIKAVAPDSHFVIVGGSPFSIEDDYPAQLSQYVADLGLQEDVHFTGQISDVAGALAAMDVFVHPGDPEPFGLVNVEAMAMTLPVVGFAHGALPEIVVEGETGLLVPAGDVDALANEVSKLLSDRQRRIEMGIAGRARVESHFTAERVARDVGRLLNEVMTKSM